MATRPSSAPWRGRPSGWGCSTSRWWIWGAGCRELPFRLDFDEFEDQHPEIEDQRFYGFQKLSLNNGFADSSLVREKVMNDLLRASGVPAARAAFYRVYVDHGEGSTYFGLYTVVEVPDDPMFEKFAASGHHLFCSLIRALAA